MSIKTSLSRTELLAALDDYRRHVRRMTIQVVVALLGFSAILWLLLGTLSPKRGGAFGWVALMSVVFLLALRQGRRFEVTLAASRPKCPICGEGLSGTWAEVAVESGVCPMCEQPMYSGHT